MRIIAGTLLEVGRGKLTPSDIAGILKARDRACAGPTLGPEGLRLEWIRYPGDPDQEPPRWSRWSDRCADQRLGLDITQVPDDFLSIHMLDRRLEVVAPFVELAQ